MNTEPLSHCIPLSLAATAVQNYSLYFPACSGRMVTSNRSSSTEPMIQNFKYTKVTFF